MSPPAPTTRISTATPSARPLIARARRVPPDLPAPLDRPALPVRPARRGRRERRDRPAPRAPPGQQDRPAPRAPRDRPGRRGPLIGTCAATGSATSPPAPTTRTST